MTEEIILTVRRVSGDSVQEVNAHFDSAAVSSYHGLAGEFLDARLRELRKSLDVHQLENAAVEGRSTHAAADQLVE